jgi:hypothetical protein
MLILLPELFPAAFAFFSVRPESIKSSAGLPLNLPPQHDCLYRNKTDGMTAVFTD